MNTEKAFLSSSTSIVERYLTFFRQRQHLQLPGSPLAVAGNTTSFVIAGMQPLLPFLRGQVEPPSTRLTALQRCLRADDVEQAGTNNKNNTAFFMLGNWSIGDYGKYEAILMAFTFLLDHLHIDKSRLWVTIFAGDEQLGVPQDEEALNEWLRMGMPAERIVPLGREDNFWTMGGPGPCGPCSEMFVDRGGGCGLSSCQPGCSCERFLEVWNLVFMQYELLSTGSIVPLPLRCIDTGMGLERTASVLQETESVFSIDLFTPALSRLQELSSSQGSQTEERERRARRVIVDHVRAALLAGVSGVLPGRDGRNSVVRRLLRRAARQGRVLGITGPFLSELLRPLVVGHGNLLSPQEQQQVPLLRESILHEERLFDRVLTTGLRYLEQLEPGSDGLVAGEHLFRLHAEKGFPADLAAEVLAERNVQVDWSGYQRSTEEHRTVSRRSAETHFRSLL